MSAAFAKSVCVRPRFLRQNASGVLAASSSSISASLSVSSLRAIDRTPYGRGSRYRRPSGSWSSRAWAAPIRRWPTSRTVMVSVVSVKITRKSPTRKRFSKPQRHPDMARLKSQPYVEPLRIDAGVMREQFDQLAALAPCLRDRPLHQLLADPAAAAMRGDADVLDQAARGALRAQSRQDAELQAADHRSALLRDHQLDIGSLFERLDAPEIAWRQRLFEPFARAAERIVHEHPHDDTDVVATRRPHGD